MNVFSLSCLERDRATGEFTVSERNDLQFLSDDSDFVINPTVVIRFSAVSLQIPVYFNWGFNPTVCGGKNLTGFVFSWLKDHMTSSVEHTFLRWTIPLRRGVCLTKCLFFFCTANDMFLENCERKEREKRIWLSQKVKWTPRVSGSVCERYRRLLLPSCWPYKLRSRQNL